LEATLIRWTIVASCALLATVLSAAPARADSNSALAEALFGEGKQLMNAGNAREACPKFEESYRLDPAAGTLLNLALCHERLGRTATAWSEFKDAVTTARKDGRADREKFAAEHVKTLEPTLSRLTVVVPQGSRVAGLEIKVDNTALGEALWGTALPFDPGTHLVTATAPHKRAWTSSIELGAKSDRREVSVGLLVDEPTDQSVPAVVPPAPMGGPGQPITDQAAPSSTRTIVLVGEGILAAGGLAVGIGYLLAASSVEDRAKKYQTQIDARGLGQVCNAPPPDLQTVCGNLSSTISDRNRDRTLSVVGFVGAGIGAAALVTTWLLWNPSAKGAHAMRIDIDPRHRFVAVGWRY
jgi:hypothetical protein